MIIRYKSAREQRKSRIRKRLKTLGLQPRLSVFRSNAKIYAQIIDDNQGKTLVSASDLEIKTSGKTTKIQRAQAVGDLLAQRAKKERITAIKFDRGPYKYHGRVKALAEAARKGGLKF